MANHSYNELNPTQQSLIDAAEKAMSASYAPYSNFNVGAGLHTVNGTIITGANVENAAYGSTICAERSTVVSAYAQGHKVVKAIAVIGRAASGPAEMPVAPCGACRQMLFEAAARSGSNMEVIFSNTAKTDIVITTIKDLLPYGFGPENL